MLVRRYMKLLPFIPSASAVSSSLTCPDDRSQLDLDPDVALSEVTAELDARRRWKRKKTGEVEVGPSPCTSSAEVISAAEMEALSRLAPRDERNLNCPEPQGPLEEALDGALSNRELQLATAVSDRLAEDEVRICGAVVQRCFQLTE